MYHICDLAMGTDESIDIYKSGMFLELLRPQLWRSGWGILVSVVCMCVRPSVQEPCMLGFWNFIYGFLMEIYLTHIFFFSCPSYLPFWSYAPLKKSKWNLMHAISYELCALGFWNFIYMDSSWKRSWPVFFFFLSYLPFWSYAQHEILSARYLKKHFS